MPLTYRLCLSPVSNLYIGSIRSGGLQYSLALPQEDLMADDKKKIMTTDAGRPVGDNQNSLTVGARGPVVYEDFLLFEKMAHFNRERIPERVVHAKGSGAHGHLVCTNPDMAKWTSAKLFEKAGKATPMFIRFSTVG